MTQRRRWNSLAKMTGISKLRTINIIVAGDLAIRRPCASAAMLLLIVFPNIAVLDTGPRVSVSEIWQAPWQHTCQISGPYDYYNPHPHPPPTNLVWYALYVILCSYVVFYVSMWAMYPTKIIQYFCCLHTKMLLKSRSAMTPPIYVGGR